MTTLKRLNHIVAFLLIVLGIVFIGRPVNYSLFFFFLVYMAVRLLDRRMRWGLQEWHYSYVLVIFYFSFFGDNLFMFFYTFIHYDKFLHFINPLIVTFIIASSSMLSRRYLSILLSLCISSIVEIGEFLMDRYLGTVLQGVFRNFQGNAYMTPLVDTIFDMAFAFTGSLLGFLLYLLWSRRSPKADPAGNKL